MPVAPLDLHGVAADRVIRSGRMSAGTVAGFSVRLPLHSSTQPAQGHRSRITGKGVATGVRPTTQTRSRRSALISGRRRAFLLRLEVIQDAHGRDIAEFARLARHVDGLRTQRSPTGIARQCGNTVPERRSGDPSLGRPRATAQHPVTSVEVGRE